MCGCQHTARLAYEAELSVLSEATLFEAVIPGFYSLLMHICPCKSEYVLSTCGEVN